MYRHIMRQQVVYGQYREYMDIHRELTEAMAAKGYTTYILMAPTVGTMNEAVLFADYDTLEQWRKDSDGFSNDADLMKLIRRQSEYVVQGSVSDQLYETIESLA
jgi:hypothetical protein